MSRFELDILFPFLSSKNLREYRTDFFKLSKPATTTAKLHEYTLCFPCSLIKQPHTLLQPIQKGLKTTTPKLSLNGQARHFSHLTEGRDFYGWPIGFPCWFQLAVGVDGGRVGLKLLKNSDRDLLGESWQEKRLECSKGDMWTGCLPCIFIFWTALVTADTLLLLSTQRLKDDSHIPISKCHWVHWGLLLSIHVGFNGNSPSFPFGTMEILKCLTLEVVSFLLCSFYTI